MKAGLDKRWTHSNHSTDFCLHCFYHQDQPINQSTNQPINQSINQSIYQSINDKSWSLPRSGLKRTADGAVLAQSSLESQRSELEGEVEMGIPFDFKRKSWSSEKIYDIFPRHDFNILVNHSEMCKCQHEYVANENRLSLQSDEAKDEKRNNHMKKSKKCSICPTHPSKITSPKFSFWETKKKTVKLVQNGSSGGESESEKEDALLARYKCPWGKERLLGWNLKSRICFCWDVFFSSLESKVVGLFFWGGDWGT